MSTPWFVARKGIGKSELDILVVPGPWAHLIIS